MRGDILPWFTTFLIVLTVMLMLFVVVLLPRAARLRVVTRKLHCPWIRRNVVVRYLTCDGRHPVDVMSCTAFADPTVVTCEKRCMGDGRETFQLTAERTTADSPSG